MIVFPRFWFSNELLLSEGSLINWMNENFRHFRSVCLLARQQWHVIKQEGIMMNSHDDNINFIYAYASELDYVVCNFEICSCHENRMWLKYESIYWIESNFAWVLFDTVRLFNLVIIWPAACNVKTKYFRVPRKSTNCGIIETLNSSYNLFIWGGSLGAIISWKLVFLHGKLSLKL